MEECYYSHYKLWHYFQLTKSGYFQILTKRKGQWKTIFKIKVSVDPIKYCETYRKSGCSHVDGYMCNMDTCKFNTIAKCKNLPADVNYRSYKVEYWRSTQNNITKPHN